MGLSFLHDEMESTSNNKQAIHVAKLVFLPKICLFLNILMFLLIPNSIFYCYRIKVVTAKTKRVLFDFERVDNPVCWVDIG